MTEPTPQTEFALRDCAIIAVSTGLRAQTLRELRDHLTEVPPDCIYNHFWGTLLRTRFEDPEYYNEFASWASHALNDKKLAERLGAIDPARFKSLEQLRDEIVEIIEERMDESEHLAWARTDQQLFLSRSQLIVFDTGKRYSSPEELARALPGISVSSVFFHFVDGRWRNPNNQDDFRVWLSGFGERYGAMIDLLAGVDPYFFNLLELRERLNAVFQLALGGSST